MFRPYGEIKPITPALYPELFEPGIIETNAPYTRYFYHFFKLHQDKNRFGIYVLQAESKNGIEIKKASGSSPEAFFVVGGGDVKPAA